MKAKNSAIVDTPYPCAVAQSDQSCLPGRTTTEFPLPTDFGPRSAIVSSSTSKRPAFGQQEARPGRAGRLRRSSPCPRGSRTSSKSQRMVQAIPATYQIPRPHSFKSSTMMWSWTTACQDPSHSRPDLRSHDEQLSHARTAGLLRRAWLVADPEW